MRLYTVIAAVRFWTETWSVVSSSLVQHHHYLIRRVATFIEFYAMRCAISDRLCTQKKRDKLLISLYTVQIAIRDTVTRRRDQTPQFRLLHYCLSVRSFSVASREEVAREDRPEFLWGYSAEFTLS